MDFLQPAAITAVQLLVISLVVEGLAENFLWVIEGPPKDFTGTKTDWMKPRLVPFVAAVLVATLAQIDLLAFAGVKLAVPVIGYLLTGVLMARGANVLHTVFKRLGVNLPSAG